MRSDEVRDGIMGRSNNERSSKGSWGEVTMGYDGAMDVCGG